MYSVNQMSHFLGGVIQSEVWNEIQKLVLNFSAVEIARTNFLS